MANIDREKPKHDTVMDVTAERIARVYAVAFSGVAIQSPNAQALIDEMNSLVADVLDAVPQFEETMHSALISGEKKEQLIGRVLGNRLSPQVVNFLKVLSRHGRLDLLRPIVRIINQLATERAGLVKVEVRVATELEDSLRADIQQRIERALNKKAVMQIAIDPALIAGIWVRVGDQVFDGSIRTQLEHVRRRMIELATEKIETEPERFVKATG